jgi:hypothetical protein
MTRAVIRMINLEGQIVATKELEVGSIEPENLKIIERAQNQVLAQIGFAGYCRVEPA